jgi:hypothetical protein
MGKAKSENTDKSDKRVAPSTAWKPGQSGNPGGRPRNEVSLTHWLREWGGMTSAQAAELCATYAKELRAAKSGEMPLAALAALRVWMTVISEPTPGLFGQLLDRMDGPVPTRLEGGERPVLVKLDR